MDPLHRIAERRLQEAIDAGALDDYPGKGEPLALEDLSGIDPELRAAYVLLQGHGIVGEESQLRSELVSLHALIAACHRTEEREDLDRRRRGLRLR